MQLKALMTMVAALTLVTACKDDGGDSNDVGGSGDGSGADDGGDATDDGGDESDDGSSGGDDGTSGEDDGGTTSANDSGGSSGDGSASGTGSTGDETTGGDCGPDPGWGSVAVGQPIKHIIGNRADGTPVNLNDFCGTPIVIDISTVWCGPCQDISAYLSGSGADPFESLGPQLRSMIEEDTIIWITYLTQNQNSGPAVESDAEAWENAYPHDKIPVLVGADVGMLESYFNVQCFPNLETVDENGSLLALDDCETWNQLQQLVNLYGG